MEDKFAGCLEELERRNLIPEQCRAVILTGSVVRGWDNASSDYDISVISGGPSWSGSGRDISVPLQPPTVPTELFHVDGRRWELKYWLDEQVDQMIGKVSWVEFEKVGFSSGLLTDQEEVFVERLISCIPWSGDDWVAQRRQEIAASAFGTFTVTRSLDKADGCAEDALGQLAAGDIESSVLSARKAFGHAIDALLESLGEYGGYYIPKWRARRFRAAAPTLISFDEYWKTETMMDFDPAAPEVWVKNVVALCKSISLKVEI
jgi:predicted nucleotidyltransferase